MPDRRPDDLHARLLATFRVEADEHLRALRAHLLALESGPAPAAARERLEAAFRAMHTLKGAARSVGLREVERVGQACEGLLSRLTRGTLPLTRPLLARLHDALDIVAGVLAQRERPAEVEAVVRRLEEAARAPVVTDPELVSPPGPPPPEPVAVGPALVDSVRVSTAALDRLLLAAEELVPRRLAAGERAREARALLEALAACRCDLERRPAGAGPAGDGGAARALRAVEGRARDLLAQLSRDHRALAGAVSGLQEGLRQLRLTPAATVLDLFPAMVQDLARAHGKEVEWEAVGAEQAVDRKVLEVVKDALLHLVRNAVDHGIEPPAVRLEAGKPRAGRIQVAVRPLEGQRVEIRVEDDGRGIDLDRVRRAAVRARALGPEGAEALGDEAALRLVFRSGVTTSPIVTELSGHGLGLGIVQEQVERLGGRVDVETQPGRGTRFRLVVPAGVATFRGLLVRAGRQPFLLPVGAVERVLRVAPGAVERLEGREALRWEGGALPCGRLAALLGLPRDEPGPAADGLRPCVLLAAGAERGAFLVEAVEGDQEVLVKPLRPPLRRVRHVAGAGLLGTGRIVLILRPADLLAALRTAPRSATPAAPSEPRVPTVLVVDDSITTRTMEKNLLEAAGYRVRVAVDGLDAWTLLRTEPVDLVVSDVDMPRMDGFELTARIRQDPRLAELPVVLVTALESREDRERGIAVGANAYVAKSSFDQTTLLDLIRRLA